MRFLNIFFLFLVLLCFSIPAKSQKVYSFAKVMPSYYGCEEENTKKAKEDCTYSSLMNFIGRNIVYPDSAIINGIEGKVVARFVVKENGSVDSISILRDPGMGLGDEVKRILSMMPDWNPGLNEEGEAISVLYTIPIKFRLEDYIHFQKFSSFSDVFCKDFNGETIKQTKLLQIITDTLDANNICGVEQFASKIRSLNITLSKKDSTSQTFFSESGEISPEMLAALQGVAVGDSIELSYEMSYELQGVPMDKMMYKFLLVE